MTVTTGIGEGLVRSVPRGRGEGIVRPQPAARVVPAGIFAGILAGIIAGIIAGTLGVACGGEPDRARPVQGRSAQVRSPAGRMQPPPPQERPAGRGSNPVQKKHVVKIDHAVKQAAGDGSGKPRCSQCQRVTCPQCERPAGDGNQVHRECQHGLCPAHCPVRPDVFGFYGTQWRKWPGSGVVRASNNEAVTPGTPRAAEVPGPDEESPEAGPATGDRSAAIAPESTGEAEAVAAFTEEEAEAEEEPEVVEEPQFEVDSPVDRDPAAAAPPEEIEEEASSTAWRSFTAAERRRREARK